MTDDTGGNRKDPNRRLGADAEDDELPPPPFRLTPEDPSDSVRIIGPADEPPLRFNPDDTGPLPHWTGPPPGAVPPISAPAALAHPSGVAGRGLPMAVGVGVAVGAVAWVLLALGARFAMALVVAVLGLAAIEFYDKLREKGYQPATLAGLAAVAALPLAAYWK